MSKRFVKDLIQDSFKGIAPKYAENSDILVINQRCIRDFRIDFSLTQGTDGNKESFEKKILQDGDILINSTGIGTAGRCAFFEAQNSNKKYVVDSHILVIRCKSFHEAKCLSFFLFSIESKLMTFLTGSSGQAEFDKEILKNIEVKFGDDPIIHEQITTLFSFIIEKISLNNRINWELEAMAKLIYDYWFVQFDFPDANGRPYKSSGGKMAYNELLKREIPEGWSDGLLGDLGEIIGGSTPSKAVEENFCQGNGTPWITPKDLSVNTSNKFILRGEFDVTEKGLKDASLKLMPRGTILMSSRAPIGYMAIAKADVTTNQGFKSFVPNKNYDSSFIFYKVKESMGTIEKNASGSTFREISSGVLKSIKIVLPSSDVTSSYSDKIQPIFRRQELLEEENQKLSELRDWLLPMLMNGQVRVGTPKGASTKRYQDQDLEVGHMSIAAEPEEDGYGK